MSMVKNGSRKMAVKIAQNTFAALDKGVKRLVREIRPVLNTYRYISGAFTETEIAGVYEIITVEADLSENDTVGAYICSLAESAGRNCKTEIFLYSTENAGTAEGSFAGRRYPATVFVTKLGGDSDGAGIYGYKAEFYINGGGTDEERVII